MKKTSTFSEKVYHIPHIYGGQEEEQGGREDGQQSLDLELQLENISNRDILTVPGDPC